MICRHCKKATVEWVLPNEPWSPGHWQCPVCDSTYMQLEKDMKDMKVKLISLNEDLTTRTREVVGDTHCLPAVNQSFSMLAAPLESGDVRLVTTSLVVSIVHTDYVYLFGTETGSSYRLEIM